MEKKNTKNIATIRQKAIFSHISSTNSDVNVGRELIKIPSSPHYFSHSDLPITQHKYRIANFPNSILSVQLCIKNIEQNNSPYRAFKTTKKHATPHITTWKPSPYSYTFSLGLHAKIRISFSREKKPYSCFCSTLKYPYVTHMPPSSSPFVFPCLINIMVRKYDTLLKLLIDLVRKRWFKKPQANSPDLPCR